MVCTYGYYCIGLHVSLDGYHGDGRSKQIFQVQKCEYKTLEVVERDGLEHKLCCVCVNFFIDEDGTHKKHSVGKRSGRKTAFKFLS